MKKLVLGLAFCFSMGAFAQTHNTPPDISTDFCEVISITSENLSSHCWPFTSSYYGTVGTFNFSVCNSLLSQHPKEIAQRIFDHLCEYQTLPQGVLISSFTPAKPVKVIIGK